MFKFKSYSEFEEDSKNTEKSSEKEDLKDIKFGYFDDGTAIEGKLKSGHTLEFLPAEVEAIQKMKITQFRDEMITHKRGGRIYMISKKNEKRINIFHLNQTINKLVLIGFFNLPSLP